MGDSFLHTCGNEGRRGAGFKSRFIGHADRRHGRGGHCRHWGIRNICGIEIKVGIVVSHDDATGQYQGGDDEDKGEQRPSMHGGTSHDVGMDFVCVCVYGKAAGGMGEAWDFEPQMSKR